MTRQAPIAGPEPRTPSPAPAVPETRSGGRRSDGRRGRPSRGSTGGALGALLIVLALFGAWELYVDLGSIDPLILPAPHTVAQALYEDRVLLWEDFKVTAGETLLGILIAGIGGFVCAVALHLSLVLRRSVYPLLVASQTIPIVLVAPLLIVWLGFGIAPKLVVIGLISFFPIVVTTLDALARVDPELLKLLRTLDASRLRVLRHVELPAALPGLFSGAKIAVAVAVIGVVFAEWIGSSSGLGHNVQQAIPNLDTARAYAAVLILSAFAITLFGLLTLAERLIVPWARNPPGGTDR